MDRADFSVFGCWLDPKWVLLFFGALAALVGAWAFGVVRGLAASGLGLALVVWGLIWVAIASYNPPQRPFLRKDRNGFFAVAAAIVLVVVLILALLLVSGMIPNPQTAGQTQILACSVGVKVSRFNAISGTLPVAGVIVNISFPGIGTLPMNGPTGPLSGTTDSSGSFIVQAFSCTQGVQVAFRLTTGAFTTPQTTPNTSTTVGLLQASGDIFSPVVP